MRNILTALIAISLSACAFILPIDHDPVMFDHLVDVKIAISKTTCHDKDWKDLNRSVEKMKVYSELRDDPQAESAKSLEEALAKAHASKNEKFCESVLKVSTTRVDVIVKAWSGR
mgnify:FL=1|tara:strand:+ start:1225 stop:1569 length:345 start_codon:yes stop_codon:yes gene_type:complete